MIGLDTNVLLRYIVRDDPAQAEIAIRIIEQQCTPDAPGFVNQIALCELAWTLAKVYRYRRAQIGELLTVLLRTDRIQVEEPHDVALAVVDYLAGHDFADSLIARKNLRSGCAKTVTFDQRATRISSMESAHA